MEKGKLPIIILILVLFGKAIIQKRKFIFLSGEKEIENLAERFKNEKHKQIRPSDVIYVSSDYIIECLFIFLSSFSVSCKEKNVLFAF